jgi:PTS system ascorbate-specific IIB component
MLKIETLCANGMGSSLVLKMSVDRALKQLGIPAEVNAKDLASFTGDNVDVIVTSPQIANSLSLKPSQKLILVVNYLDVDKLKELLSAAL